MPWGITRLESYCRRLPEEDHLLRENTGNKSQRMSRHLRTYPSDLLELIQRFETQPVIYSQLMGLLNNDPSLKEIKLTDIGIGDDAAKALAQVLQTNTSLEKVDLTGNKIGDDGATALAEALKGHRSIKDIVLRENSIGDDAAKALAQALQTNTSLEKVDLTRNKIGDDAANALREDTRSRPWGITRLKRHCESLNANALAQASQTNTSLEKVDLTGNKIGDDAANALSEDTRSRPWGTTPLKGHSESLNSNPPRTNRRWSHKPSRPW